MGLPAGAQIPLRFGPNFTTVTYTATDYTTKIPVYISSSTNTTYSGSVPYQWQGAGTTVTYNGVTYTMVSNTYTESLQVGKPNVLGFYVYLNSILWNTNETDELTASNSSLSNAQIMIASIKNVSVTIPYNGATSVGNVVRTASDSNGTITFTKTQVQQNPSYICINITSQYYSGDLCNPGTQSLPIPEINGHFGLNFKTGPNVTSITAKLQSSLAHSQTMAYNAVINAGGETYLLQSNEIGNGYSDTVTFNYIAGTPLNITLDGLGNANYSFEDPTWHTPSSIVAWFNYTVVNNDPVNAIHAGQVLVVPINTPSFGAYANGQFDNWVVFNGYTGNILYSYMLGNSSNTFQTQSLNTVLSSNFLLYVQTDFSVPASGTDTNAFAIGYYSMATDSMNGNNIGEFPTATCTNGVGGLSCGSYSIYDNGAKVFPFYDNFKGTTLNGILWSESNSGGNYFVSNGITINSLSYITFAANSVLVAPQTLVADLWGLSGTNNYYGLGGANIMSLQSGDIPGNTYDAQINGGNGNSRIQELNSQVTLISTVSATFNALIQFNWTATGKQNLAIMVSSGNPGKYVGSGTDSTSAITNYYPNFGVYTGGTSGSSLYWYFTYNAFYHLPTITNGIVQTSFDPTGPSFSTNVINYIPVTLTNPQTTAYQTGATVWVDLNASKYEQYETCNLNNVAFYWQNDSVIPSWMLGNETNPVINNALCTSDTSPGALAQSKDVRFAVDLGTAAGNFLAGSTSNTFLLGFSGNVVSASGANIPNTNTLWSLVTNTGTAPEITCTGYVFNTLQGITSCNQQYGTFDDGANVFTNYYTNFAGGTLPASITLNGGTTIVNNGMAYSSVGFNTLTTSQSATFLGNSVYSSSFETHYNVADFPIQLESVNGNIMGLADANGYCGESVGYTFGGYNGVTQCLATNVVLGNWNTTNAIPVMQIYDANALCGQAQFNNGTKQSLCWNSATNLGFSSSAAIRQELETGSNANVIVFWEGDMVDPPNDVEPTVQFGTVQPNPFVYSSPTVTLGKPSNVTAYPNSIVTLPVYTSGGAMPFNYLYTIYNNATNAVITTFRTANVDSGNYAWAVPFNNVLFSNGIYSVNVLVTDVHGNTILSTNTLPIQYINQNVCNGATQLNWPLGTSYNWMIENTGFVGENNDLYCSNSLTQYVDSAGVMHVNNVKTSASVAVGSYLNMTQHLGYGVYNFKLAGDLSNLDPQTDFSPYLWDSSPGGTNANFHREIDVVEVSKFGELKSGFNWEFGVQPEANHLMVSQNTINIPGPFIASLNYMPNSVTLTFKLANGTDVTQLIYANTANVQTPGNAMATLINWNPAQQVGNGNIVATSQQDQFLNFNFTPALGLTISNTILDAGQYITLTANTLPSFSSYTYNFMTQNTVNGITHNTLWANVLTSNSVTFQVTIADSQNTVQLANVSVKYGTNSVTSNSLTFLVHNALADSFTAVNSPVSYGQTQTIKLTTDGGSGTPPYQYNIMVYNAFGLVTNILTPFTVTTSNVFSYTQSSTWLTGTFTVNAAITDSASTPVTVTNTLTYTAESSAFALTSNSISNTHAIQGQTETLTIGTSNPASYPITYNYLVTNAQTPNTIFSSLVANSATSDSNSISFTLPLSATDANDIGTLTFTANAVDGSADLTAIGTNTFTVANIPHITSWSATNVLLDSGQTETLKSTIANNGFGTFSGNFDNDTGSQIVFNQLTGIALGAQSMNSFVVTSPTNGNVFIWSFNAVDNGATTPYPFNSGTLSFTVNTAIQANSPIETNSIIDTFQFSKLTAEAAGGTLPYTYNWYTISGSTAPTCTTANQITGATSSTYTAEPISTNSYAYQVVDSATTNSVVCSSGNTITVDTEPVFTQTQYSSAFLDSGQLQKIEIGFTGGAGPFTVNFVNFTSGTAVVFNTLSGVTASELLAAVNSFIVNSPTNGNVFTWTANVVDTGTTTPYSFNSGILGTSFTVNAVLSSGFGSPSNPSMDLGQTVTLHANPSGGTLPYTFNWFESVGNPLCLPGNFISGSTATNALSVDPGSTGSYHYTYNVIDSASTPNSVCSIQDTVTVNALPVLSANTVANTPVDQGQVETLTEKVTGGTPPYTYNFLVTNAVSGNIIFSAIEGSTSQTNTISFTMPSSPNAIGTLTFTSNVVDGSTVANEVTGIGTNTFTAATAFALTSIVSSNGFAIQGQTETLTIVTSNPASFPITYNFLAPNVFDQNVIFSAIISNSLTTNSVSFVLPLPATNANDISSIGFTGNAVDGSGDVTSVETNSFTVENIPLFTGSAATSHLDSGQKVTMQTFIGQNGYGADVVNLINETSGATGVWNTVTGLGLGHDVANVMTVSSPTNGNVFTFQFNGLDTLPTTPYPFNTQVSFTVNTAIQANAPVMSNTIIDSGQISELTEAAAGGTPPYTTYNWYTISGSTAPTCTTVNQITGASSSTYKASPTGTNSYAYQVTDSATTPNVVCSNGNTVTVGTALGVPTISESNAILDTGQIEKLTGTDSGGTANFKVTFYNITGSASFNIISGISSFPQSNTFSVSSPTIANVFQFNVIVQDSASTPEITNSIPGSFTVYPVLLSTGFTSSSASITEGSTQSLTATVSGGANTPYTYNFQVFNTFGLVDNMLVTNSFAGNIFQYSQSSSWGTGTFTVNLAVTDAATVSNTVTNTLTYTATSGVGPSVTVPANIVNYVKITLTNNQNTAISANTPIPIGYTNPTIGQGNFVGINALAYSEFTCNLDNEEFFWANGTIIKSWLEGNIFNEYVDNSLCTSSSSPNALVDSSNVLVWVGGNIFIPANSGTPGTNTIYLGWAGSASTAVNNEFNVLNNGEAPQLSCSNPFATVNCNYGEYDTGNLVFNFYDGFAGTTLNTIKWLTTNVVGYTNTLIVNNGLLLGSLDLSGGVTLTSNSVLTSTATLDTDVIPGSIKDGYGGFGTVPLIDIGWNAFSAGYSSYCGHNTGDGCGNSGNYVFFAGNSFPNPVPSCGTGHCESEQVVPIPVGLISVTESSVANNGIMTDNYSMASLDAGSLSSGNTILTSIQSITSPDNIILAINNQGGASGAANGQIGIQWIRTRTMPPNEIYPATTFGTINSLFQIQSIVSSNTVADQGQTELLTASVSIGTGPYSYNYLVINTVTGNIIFSQVVTNALTTNSVGFTLSNDMNVIGSLEVIANVVDTGSATSPPVQTNTLTVFNPIVTMIAIGGNSINQGTTVTLNANVVDGTGNYLFDWSLNGQKVVNVSISGTQSQAQVDPGTNGNFVYQVIAVDAGTTQQFPLEAVTNTVVATGGNPGTTSGGGGGGGGGSLTISTIFPTNTTLQLTEPSLPAINVPGNSTFIAFLYDAYGLSITYGWLSVPLWILGVAAIVYYGYVEYKKGKKASKGAYQVAFIAAISIVVFYIALVGVVSTT